MSQTVQWLVRIACLTVVALLAVGALPHFLDGLTIDQALPVPSYMIAHRVVPKSAYVHAAGVLRQANARNGTSRIAAAEAALHAGEDATAQIPTLQEALTQSPASPRGWMLLAQALAPRAPSRAATALSQALILGPDDYWVAGKRAQLASILWSNLDADGQDAALRQVRLMWEEPQLRPQIISLVASNEGEALVRRAFVGQRDEFVDLNRWVSATRRQSNPSP